MAGTFESALSWIRSQLSLTRGHPVYYTEGVGLSNHDPFISSSLGYSRLGSILRIITVLCMLLYWNLNTLFEWLHLRVSLQESIHTV